MLCIIFASLPSLPPFLPSSPPPSLPPRLLAFGPNRLLLAASNGDHTTIRQLVEDGVSPSHEFPRGITALHEACEGGHEEAVKVLIDLGADVNKQVYSC